MRILHITTRYRSGGSERNLLAMMRWERGEGHEVHLAVGRDSDMLPLPDGIVLHQVGALVRSVRPLQDLRATRDLRRIVQDGAFDVVHTHQSKAGVIGRLAARGVTPAIVHTIHMASFGPGYSRPSSFVFTLAERYSAGFTDMIVSVGDELRDRYLKAGIGQVAQYQVLHSPIDIDGFTAVRTTSTAESRLHREGLGLDPERSLVVSIGALEARKRPDLIIQRLAALLRQGHAMLALAGDGPERETLETLVRELGLENDIRLLGHVQEVPALLGCADAYVHAATVEGVPQTVLQAVAAGVPVVATDTVGLREIDGAPIRVIGADGSELAEAVSAVLASPPEPIKIEALAPWRPEEVSRETERFYCRLRRIVANSRGSNS